MKSPTCLIKALLIVFLLAGFTRAEAQLLNAVQNYGMNRPGVVMVKTVFSADVYVNRIQLDSRAELE